MTAFDDVYDPATVRAIDRASDSAAGAGDRRGPVRRVTGARGTLAAGAVVAAGLVGVREALEGSEDDAEIVEVRLDPGLDADAAVTVLFVPDAPAATVAVVRPWLLEQPVFRAVTGVPGAVTPRS